MTTQPSIVTPKFLDALNYAMHLHQADLRKGTKIPYITHLLGVCALVLSDGGSEDEAIAALLHDALEDHPEETSRQLIGERFGPAVLEIVVACTDTPPDYSGGIKPPWRQRKTAYIEHVRKLKATEWRVPLADKLDNLRSVVADYRQIGDTVWSRFKAGKADQLWLYRSLAPAFREAGAQGFLADEFEWNVKEIQHLSGIPIGG